MGVVLGLQKRRPVGPSWHQAGARAPAQPGRCDPLGRPPGCGPGATCPPASPSEERWNWFLPAGPPAVLPALEEGVLNRNILQCRHLCVVVTHTENTRDSIVMIMIPMSFFVLILVSFSLRPHLQPVGQDWGVSYGKDTCGDLTATSWPGLDSGLRIDREGSRGSTLVLAVSVRPGLLHLAGFWFGDVAFAGDRRECLFEANGYIYLLDIDRRRLGTLANGDRFIFMTPRYQKPL